mmetsp:Transcript_13047/g.39439  ORF Transcript_13047/g.39439 Transcript_13047/m.39439 type:complete len:106 (+) Transcript_13047:5324-5641(+)
MSGSSRAGGVDAARSLPSGELTPLDSLVRWPVGNERGKTALLSALLSASTLRAPSCVADLEAALTDTAADRAQTGRDSSEAKLWDKACKSSSSSRSAFPEMALDE